MSGLWALIAGFVLVLNQTQSALADAVTDVRVDPPEVALEGPEGRFTLLVHGRTAADRQVDLTREATYKSRDPNVVRVTSTGELHAQGDGTTIVDVVAAGRTRTVNVRVSGTGTPRRIHFENDVIPVFSKFGCNSGGCHGKAEGQQGFKLSVFGFDPAADHEALVKEGRGRRLLPSSPEQSLLLLKASGGVPHGGGVRIPKGSADYRTLEAWIAAGMPLGDPDAPRVVGLELSPDVRVMGMEAQQQLRAVAVYSDGRKLDVTRLAKYQSNREALARVDESGLVTAGKVPGEAAVMAGYMGAVDVFRVLVPQPRTFEEFPQRPVHNFIDRHVDAKLEKLNVAPAEICSDAEFLRRVSLDVIGTLPTAEEARAFLADTSSDKRARLVDSLLKRSEYADYWALKWSDLLRVDRQALGHKAAYSYHRWIRDSFAANKPMDEFVREIVAPEGLLKNAAAGNLYRVLKKPGEAASTLSQVFLGVRIECAQCHHHPFDRWSQQDYYGMQAYFTQVGFKQTPRGEIIAALKDAPTKHPRTDEEVFAHALGTPDPEDSPEGDRRKLLAEWMTAKDNRWFARNIANRYWAHFTGRGLVEPVDDFRSTNPPTNPELLGALAASFIESGYNVHALIRTITVSRTYQLSAETNPSNAKDTQNYSRAPLKRLDAEVLFDAICQTTGVPEKFRGVPSGYRAIQLWDSQVPHYFLKLFGRPTRATPCECERSTEPSVGQVLHVLNSPGIQSRLSHSGGRIRKLVSEYSDDDELVEEIYLTFYSRYPDENERNVAVTYLKNKNNSDRRQQATEDLAWSLMNTTEFLFNH